VDNILEGDTGASGLARRLRQTVNPACPACAFRVPPHVGSNFEGLVMRIEDADGGAGHLWKLVRTFDDPAPGPSPECATWRPTVSGVRAYRMSPLDDQWELYDLTTDPAEASNRWPDPDLDELRRHLRMQLKEARASSVPERNQPWPLCISDAGQSVAAEAAVPNFHRERKRTARCGPRNRSALNARGGDVLLRAASVGSGSTAPQCFRCARC